MGRDIHVRIVKRDHNTNEWKHIKLYKKEKGKFKFINPYPYRNYELFDILDGTEDEEYIPFKLNTKNLPIALKSEIEKAINTLGYYDFKEINLADLKLYLKEVPKVRDWDYDEKDPQAFKDNPVKLFIEQIEYYLDFYDSDWDIMGSSSDIRILYWFDC